MRDKECCFFVVALVYIKSIAVLKSRVESRAAKACSTGRPEKSIRLPPGFNDVGDAVLSQKRLYLRLTRHFVGEGQFAAVENRNHNLYLAPDTEAKYSARPVL